MKNRVLHTVQTAQDDLSRVAAFVDDQISKSLAAKLIDIDTANKMRKELRDADRNFVPADPARWAGVKIVGELPSKFYLDSVFGLTSIECDGEEKFFLGISRGHD